MCVGDARVLYMAKLRTMHSLKSLTLCGLELVFTMSNKCKDGSHSLHMYMHPQGCVSPVADDTLYRPPQGSVGLAGPRRIHGSVQNTSDTVH